MQIISDLRRDVKSDKPIPGSYEWWYFDAISASGEYSIVVIFYEGNPFSRRYMDAVRHGEKNVASCYPAISLSVYKNGDPLFYSFEEVLPEQAEFSEVKPAGSVKNNQFWSDSDEKRLIYCLKLNQILPGGDKLKGELTYSSDRLNMKLNGTKPPGQEKHCWNLVQPCAEVSGCLTLSGYNDHDIDFEGTGYHDHNIGHEPMRESFKEWYWGRVHFSDNTLVYYLMNEKNRMQSKAWVIGINGDVDLIEDGIELGDIGYNLFGLQSARKISRQSKKNREQEFLIQKSEIIDDGPFYQRFISKVMLHDGKKIAQGRGINEYIFPSRIHSRLFRPLVNMRIQYPGEAHWVQKNPRLYRWTW